FSSRRRHTRLQGDWSSDVCSSDLYIRGLGFSPVSFTDQRIFPVRASRQWPRMTALNFGAPSLYSSNVVRKRRSPQAIMPPCPPLGIVERQAMFRLSVALHAAGASPLSYRHVRSGPAACGQLSARMGVANKRITRRVN